MDAADAEGLDPLPGELFIDLGPLRGGEVRGGGHDGRDLVLAQPPGGVQLPDSGVTVVQVPCGPDPLAAFGGGDPAGESDLCGDTAFEGFGVDGPGGGLRFGVRPGELQNGVGLLGRDRRFPFFELRDPFDELRLGRRLETGCGHDPILPELPNKCSRNVGTGRRRSGNRLFPVEGVDGGRLERGGGGASVPG